MNNSRNKVLIFFVIFLVLTNIAMLVYFTSIRKPAARARAHGERQGPVTGLLQNEIGFDKQQMFIFDSLKQQHRVAIKPLFDALGKSKDNFYQLIGKGSVSDTVLKAAAADIGEKQSALDIQFYQNFLSIRKICTPEQQVKFDSLMPETASKMMQPWQKNNNARRKDSTELKK